MMIFLQIKTYSHYYNFIIFLNTQLISSFIL